MARSNRAPHPGVSVMGRTLVKRVEGHLKRHAGLHLPLSPKKSIRVVDARNARSSNTRTAPHVLRIIKALPLYSSSIGKVARSGVDQSAQTGMIFLLQSSSGAAFHLEADGIGKDVRLGRVNSGATAKSLQMAIRSVQKASKRASHLRVFRVSGMHFSAVWAHDLRDSKGDILVAYAPNFLGIKVSRIYRLHRAEARLRKYATQMILRWYHRFENNLCQSRRTPTDPESFVRIANL